MEIQALVEWLSALEANNNKAWFDAQADRYKRLRAGFTDMVQQVIVRTAAADERLEGVRADKSLFRIHRDVRFSKDKTPYKTAFSAAIGPDGKSMGAPSYYLHIDHAGQMLLAAGLYMPEPAQATRIRHAVLAHWHAVQRILHDPALQAAFPAGLQGEAYKRAPKGFEEVQEPQLTVIRQKSFALWHEAPVAAGATSDTVADAAVAAFTAGQPWVAFLRAALAA